MNSISAMMMGMIHREASPMVFDWHKAARIIKGRKDETASAGLRGDWEYTGGTIFIEGKPFYENSDWIYLMSTWATPELAIGNDVYPCWKYAEDCPGWNEKTFWPESALAVLNEPEPEQLEVQNALPNPANRE